MGINNINCCVSNSSYNIIYIPCPSVKKLDSEAPPSFPKLFLHISRSLDFIVPSSFLFIRQLQTQREGREQTRPGRHRGRVQEKRLHRLHTMSTSMRVCSQIAHLQWQFAQWLVSNNGAEGLNLDIGQGDKLI